MDRRVSPPKLFTSPIWGPPPPCKQVLRGVYEAKKKKKKEKRKKNGIKATNMGVAQALFILSCFAPFRLLSLVHETSRDSSVRRYIDVPSDQPKLPDKICIVGCPLSRIRIIRRGGL